jgi:hypothetical protein
VQFKWSIWKETTSFLVQSTAIGVDVEVTIAPPYITTLEEFVDVFQPLPSRLPREWEIPHILGHVVGKASIKVNPRKSETITNLHRPLEIGQLWSALGLCIYFCRFIHRYSTLVAPLTSLT